MTMRRAEGSNASHRCSLRSFTNSAYGLCACRCGTHSLLQQERVGVIGSDCKRSKVLSDCHVATQKSHMACTCASRRANSDCNCASSFDNSSSHSDSCRMSAFNVSDRAAMWPDRQYCLCLAVVRGGSSFRSGELGARSGPIGALIVCSVFVAQRGFARGHASCAIGRGPHSNDVCSTPVPHASSRPSKMMIHESPELKRCSRPTMSATGCWIAAACLLPAVPQATCSPPPPLLSRPACWGSPAPQ